MYTLRKHPFLTFSFMSVFCSAKFSSIPFKHFNGLSFIWRCNYIFLILYSVNTFLSTVTFSRQRLFCVLFDIFQFSISAFHLTFIYFPFNAFAAAFNLFLSTYSIFPMRHIFFLTFPLNTCHSFLLLMSLLFFLFELIRCFSVYLIYLSYIFSPV